MDTSLHFLHPRHLVRQPLAWLVLITIIAHSLTSWQATTTWEQLVQKDQEFHSYWDTQHKYELTQKGINPDQQQLLNSRRIFLTPFINQSLVHKLLINLEWFHPLSLITAWILQPSWLYLIFALVTGFLFNNALQSTQLKIRWRCLAPLFSLVGGNLIYVAIVEVFAVFSTEFYMGLGAGLAAWAGMYFSLRKTSWDLAAIKIPLRLPKHVLALLFVATNAGLHFLWHTPNFKLAFVIETGVFALWYSLTPRYLLRAAPKFSHTTIKTTSPRHHFGEAWRLAGLLELESAANEFKTAINKTLFHFESGQEILAEELAKINADKTIIPFSSQELYQWAENLINLSAYPLAISCLEILLKNSKMDADLAPYAALKLAELRINHNLEPDKSVPLLQKLTEIHKEDFLGSKAKFLLAQLS